MSLLWENSQEWTMDLIQKTWDAIDDVGKNTFKLDYPNTRIEIVNYRQMLDAYSSVGLPNFYSHWSFGKAYMEAERNYINTGGMAYELIINSNPTVAYCMETNTMAMMALVMAHASCGHGFVYKNNYLFKERTDADGILSYIKFSREYIDNCYKKYGTPAVEKLLTAAHRLQYHSVDVYPKLRNLTKEKKTQQKREFIDYLENLDTYEEQYFSDTPGELKYWADKKISAENALESIEDDLEDGFGRTNDVTYTDEDNLLYFIEKTSSILRPWQKEVIRIVRKIAQYFYPQRLTQVVHEGSACFIHYHIMTELYEKGKIPEGAYLEFLISHNNVVRDASQVPLSRYGMGPGTEPTLFKRFNPYYLGFKMFMDIKRICQEPTDEDKYWYPQIAGSDWLETFKYIASSFKDESFIRQWLSPHLMRELRMVQFKGVDKSVRETVLRAVEVPDEEGYRNLRNAYADEYTLYSQMPRLVVTRYTAGINSKRTMLIEAHSDNRNKQMDVHEFGFIENAIACLWGNCEIEFKEGGVKK